MKSSAIKRVQQALMLQLSDEAKSALTKKAKIACDVLAAAALCAVLSTIGAEAHAEDFAADQGRDRQSSDNASDGGPSPVLRSAVGAAIGGVIGYQFGNGKGQVLSTVLGALVGRSIGERTVAMERARQQQPQNAPSGTVKDSRAENVNPYELGAVIPELVKLGIQTHRGRGDRPLPYGDDQLLRREFDLAMNSRDEMIRACGNAESVEANQLLGRRDREYDRLKSETLRTQDNFRASKRQFFRDIQHFADGGFDMKPWNLMVGLVAATPDSSCSNYKSIVAIDRAVNAELSGGQRVADTSNVRRMKY